MVNSFHDFLSVAETSRKAVTPDARRVIISPKPNQFIADSSTQEAKKRSASINIRSVCSDLILHPDAAVVHRYQPRILPLTTMKTRWLTTD